jgi:hypothetical protein
VKQLRKPRRKPRNLKKDFTPRKNDEDESSDGTTQIEVKAIIENDATDNVIPKNKD